MELLFIEMGKIIGEVGLGIGWEIKSLFFVMINLK